MKAVSFETTPPHQSVQTWRLAVWAFTLDTTSLAPRSALQDTPGPVRAQEHRGFASYRITYSANTRLRGTLGK